jgi:hypothetical protein
MASAKRTPKVSRISRSQTLAYARKQKPAPEGSGGSGGDDGSDGGDGSDDDAPSSASAPPASSPAIEPPRSAPPAPPVPPAAAAKDAEESPEWHRARVETVSMPVMASIGAPPEMPPSAIPAPPVQAGAVEDPTHMPGPREIPTGHPDDAASPPGRVPAGDSRSMRRRTDRYEFALVYRIQTYVISRVGVVGTRGQWRVVEYPTPTMASHAYAKECSRFVSEGFSDYRE